MDDSTPQEDHTTHVCGLSRFERFVQKSADVPNINAQEAAAMRLDPRIILER